MTKEMTEEQKTEEQKTEKLKLVIDDLIDNGSCEDTCVFINDYGLMLDLKNLIVSAMNKDNKQFLEYIEWWSEAGSFNEYIKKYGTYIYRASLKLPLSDLYSPKYREYLKIKTIEVL